MGSVGAESGCIGFLVAVEWLLVFGGVEKAEMRLSSSQLKLTSREQMALVTIAMFFSGRTERPMWMGGLVEKVTMALESGGSVERNVSRRQSMTFCASSKSSFFTRHVA